MENNSLLGIPWGWRNIWGSRRVCVRVTVILRDLLHSPGEVNVPIVGWNTNGQIDEVGNTADTVKGSESIYFPLLKKSTHAWLISVPCSTTHELRAHPSAVKAIYLVHTEFMHSVCVQVWTDKKRYWETHKPLYVLSVDGLARLILTVWSNTIVFPSGVTAIMQVDSERKEIQEEAGLKSKGRL